MSIIHVGTTAGTGGTTVNIPAATQDGDFLFLSEADNQGATPPLPSGWTLIYSRDDFQVHWVLGYRIWQTGDPTTATRTSGITNIVAYRNVDQTNPIEAFAASDTVNVTEADSLVLDCIFNRSLSSFQYDQPPGLTLRYSDVSGGNGQGMADTEGVAVPTGAWPPITWTHSGGSTPPGTNSRAVLVLRPGLVVAGGWGVGYVRMG